MANIEDVIKMIENYPNLADFVGEVPESDVLCAEQELNIVLPKDYKKFLTKYGCGNFGSEEIFGVGVKPIGIPSVIWATKQQRIAEPTFPLNFVVIYNVGLGEIICLDTSPMKKEICSVISWKLGRAHGEQNLGPIANSFSEFVLEKFEKLR